MNLNLQRSWRLLLMAMSAMLVGAMGYAKPVDPSGAIAIAEDFVREGASQSAMRAPALTQSPAAVAYTSRSGQTDCFYIVNIGDGFVIVSADTRLPEVLGYSDAGAFDIDKASDNMKWWLSQYELEISNYLPSAPETAASEVNIRRINRAPIEPITKTKWDQGAPYNNDCPMDGDYHARSVTGCVATAMAQLMKVHNWPLKPVGNSGGIVFTGSTFDWDDMLDVYEDGKYNAKQSAAVARLMRYCGAGVNMRYSAYMSGAYDVNVKNALVSYFGYASDIQTYWKDYTPQSRWNDLVYSELAAGRPLYYSGSSSRGGHAFVCDGYSSNEYFHFNWGWGGYQDGYYRLTALNPETGGAGSYEGGYNSGQTILTGVRPSNGETDQQYAILSSGAFIYKDGLWTTEESINVGYDLFYNPLYVSDNFYFGLKVIRTDVPDAEPVYFTSPDTGQLQPNYGVTGYPCNIGELEDGTYHVYGVFKVQGKDWMDIQVPLGKQDYVTLTVAGGEQTLSNDGPDPDFAPHLIMGTPKTANVLPGNAEKYFRIPFINTGKGDYLGEISISLFGEDEFGDIVSAAASVTIPGESYAEVEFSIADKVSPGEYTLYVMDADGRELSTEYKYTFTEDVLEVPSGKLAGSELAPNFFTTDEERVMYVTVVNDNLTPVTSRISLVLCNEKFEPVSTVTTNGSVTVNAKSSQRLAIGPVRFDGVTPGIYYWYAATPDGVPFSYPTPMIIESPIRTMGWASYIITDGKKKECELIAPEGEPYSGSVCVPDHLGEYTVTHIRQDAFAFATATDVTLPATVGSIEDGGFIKADYLYHLTLQYPGVVSMGDETFDKERIGHVWLGVADGYANTYARTDGWSGFVLPCWRLQPKDGIIVTGVQVDPATAQPYDPYYMGPNETLTLGAVSPGGENILYSIVKDGEWTSAVISSGSMTFNVPALGWKTGRIDFNITNQGVGVETIDADTDNLVGKDVFSVDGVAVLRAATEEQLRSLRPGLYIIGSRKVLVK